MKKLILFILLFIGLSNTSWLQPPNDYCSTAQSITPDGTCYGGTTVGADDSWISSVACQGGGTHPDVWYSFTATNTQLDYIVTPSAPWVGDIEFILVEATGGPCSGLVLAGSHCGAGPISGSITGIQVGALYYFTISNASGGTPGPFQVCVNNVAAPISPGQDCGNAAILCNGNPFSQGVFVGVGVVENISTNTCFGANERQSKWYKFTAGCSGTFGFNIIPNNPADDYDFILWNTTAGCYTAGSTMGIPMACNWSGTTGSTGINYYGNIGLIEPNPCSAAGAIDCVAGGGPNAGCQPCTYYNSTAGNYNPVNLVAGETYTLLIDNFSASGSGFSIDFGGTAVMGPDAHFTSSPTGCNSYSFTKTCQIPNGSYTFNWAFGDGNFSSLQNPSHTYVTPGSYTVTLEATDALGCVAAYSINITVGFPDASAGSDQTLSCASPQVVLNGSSATAPVSFAWAGPGIVSGGTTATPTVNAPGVYTITVTNTSNGCTATSTVTVTSSIDPPLASAGTPQTLTCTTTSVVLNGSGSASGGGPFWTEDFGIGCNQNQVASSYTGPNGAWNITLTGANGSHANQFFVSATEAGMGAGNCGDGCLGNPGLTNRTLHIANVANSSIACFFCPTGDCGAAYDASNPNGFMASFCGPLGRSPLSDRRAESPVINCSGKSTITLSFNYMEGGSGLNDNATLWYFDGAVWAQLSDMAKTPTTCSPQGLWTAYSFPLPASANNNPNVRIGFRWVNNTDDAGSDPSFAVDDIVLSSPASPVTYSWTGPGIVSGGTTATPTVNAAGNYTITVTNPANGCTATSSVLVSSNTTPPTANAGAPQTLTCASSSVVLDGSASSVGVNFTYNWAGPGIVSGGTTTAPTVNAAGTYTITVTNTSNGCTSSSQVTVSITVSTPDASAGSDLLLPCNTSSIFIVGSSITPGVNYAWTTIGGNILSGATQSNVEINAPGIYILTVTNPANSCTNTDTMLVLLPALPTVTALEQTSVSCYGLSDGVAEATGAGGLAPYIYYWSDGSSNVSIQTSAGIYTVTLTDDNGCSATATVQIMQPTQLYLSLVDTVSPDCGSFNGSIEIVAMGGTPNYTYTWNNSTTTGAILSGISEGSYTGYVTDANNCIDSMTIVLTCKELPLFIPQLLSPNGDGKNDVWVILNLDNYPNNLVKIFNRWGNQVYISNPYLNDWDGKSNAALSIGAGILPAGTYFYVIDLHGDGANILSGYLELQP